ncbi:hypothetical protein BDQ12DRAFT_657621 [Crucibulum laeve]|uniref:Uncharacterized protein n=1 Tax=Crucibulum laeve TaxID=68775 RepID=A0A5C3LLN4_9AGAR|nr:hypothetical protein BDQ12DRAFT_657621 [Crucibulum laeve]
MEPSHILALGVFGFYFIIILALFGLIIPSFQVKGLHTSSSKGKAILFVFLTAASFTHTWFYMFKYMFWSFKNYEASLAFTTGTPLERVSNWLVDTSLFEEAWAAVCFGRVNWWWSEQLCLFTVGGWTVFLATEGRRSRVKHLWAYMLLGQVVAISVASNLFYLALVLSRPSSPSASSTPTLARPKLWISVLISLATIAASPFTSERTFLPNLLVMHAVLVVPLVASASVTSQKKISSRFSLRVSTLYLIVFVASAAMRLRTIKATLGSLPSQDYSPYGLFSVAWDVLHAHPAQSSIGWDVVWTSLSFIAWVSTRPSDSTQASKVVEIPYLLLATPFASVGVTAPYILRPRGELSADAKDE